jgi:N-acyl-D-aspartate/D-glutamate deacylase
MLRGRGVISEGFWADIVIFDRDEIIDKATYEDPHKFPEGIEYVLVNGEVVVDKGSHTGILAGKILRLN